MTKEEALNKFIERYKSQKDRDLLEPVDCCYGINCDDCPFHAEDCTEGLVMSLLDRLVKAEEQSKSFEKTCYKLQQALEEHQETNLEHFRGTVVFDKANGIVHIHLINEWGKSYSDDKGAIDWLLSPYEEPKPKFKLTQFEYDLLKCYDPSYVIIELWLLTVMQSKGYFKDIPTDVPIRDILDNCEVVDE